MHVFRADRSGGWSELAVIAAPSRSVPDDRFGDVLALQGTSAIVAAAWADSGRGAVYLYGGDGWTQLARISPDSLTANARFGSAIEIGEDVVLVGPRLQRFPGRCSRLQTRGGAAGPGSARSRSRGRRRNGSAASIAIAGEEAWIGAPGSDRFHGAIYSLSPGPQADSGWRPSS